MAINISKLSYDSGYIDGREYAYTEGLTAADVRAKLKEMYNIVDTWEGQSIVTLKYVEGYVAGLMKGVGLE